MLSKLYRRSPTFLQNVILVSVYAFVFVLSLGLAYLLRFDFHIPDSWQLVFYQNLTWIIPLKLAFLFVFGQFEELLSYFRLPDLYRLFFILGLSSSMVIGVWYITGGADCPPRSVILGDFIFSLFLLSGFRIALRVIHERQWNTEKKQITKTIRRAAIIGAGDTGAAIAANLLAKPKWGIRPVVFLDDDVQKWRRDVHGIMVIGPLEKLSEIKSRFNIQSIIIAIPSASRKRVNAIVQRARETQLDIEIAPSLKEWATGKTQKSPLRPIAIEDLLGRDPVRLDTQLINQMIANEVVMITGAGGSIGSELCYQTITGQPRQLILIEQSEYALFRIEQKLKKSGLDKNVQCLVGDILDKARIDAVMRKFAPTLIFHAAAHKHVPLMEYQPSEAIKNNVLGTKIMADLAGQYGAKQFILISTDKAINPTSVMGASKRLAEIYIQAKQNAPDNKTRFSAVRFGNVFDSSGSVVSLFKEQIARGDSLKVTHPDATRYFMTVSEAVELVLQSATQGKGGDIFVLDMGQSIKVLDLAHQMIKLSGLQPDIDIKIEFIGLRPGEKLHEEIYHKSEKVEPTNHPQILRFICEAESLQVVTDWILELSKDLDNTNNNVLKQKFQSFIPEYQPYIKVE